MPDPYKVEGDAVAANRKYYLKDKGNFAVWKLETPQWFINGREAMLNVLNKMAA